MANTHPQLAVKGAGFDRSLGGLEMDLRLRKYLADQFDVREGGGVVCVCV